MIALLRLARLIDTLNEKVGKGVGWLVLLTCLICTYNALVRKVLNESSNAYLEIQWYLFGFVFLLGAAYTFKANEHVRIDVLSSKLGPRGQAWIDVIGILTFLTPLTALVIYHGIPFFMESYTRGEMSSDAGGLVRWPAKLAIVLGFVLLQLQALSELIKRIAQLSGAIPFPADAASTHPESGV